MRVHRAFGGFDNIPQHLELLGRAILQQEKQVLEGLAGLMAAKKQVICPGMQRGGQRRQRRQAQLGVARFDMAHVGGRDADFLRQFLLGELVLLAQLPDSLADFIVIQLLFQPISPPLQLICT